MFRRIPAHPKVRARRDVLCPISRFLICVEGKGGKIRYIPLHPLAMRLIQEYLAGLVKCYGKEIIEDLDGPLFRPVKNNRTGTLNKHLDPSAILKNIESGYKVLTHTVTALGLRMYEEKLFRKNGRNRVRDDLRSGTFGYEGAQAMDDPAITVWKFKVYGGLASYEDKISPETMGSHLVSITGPETAFSGTQ